MSHIDLNIKPVLLNVGIAKHHGDWNFKDISSPFTRIHYVKSGSAKIIKGGKSIELKPGHMYITPSYTSHSYENEGEFVTYYIHIYFESSSTPFSPDRFQMPDEIECKPQLEELFIRLCELHPDKSLSEYDPNRYENSTNMMSNSGESSLSASLETKGILMILLSKCLEGVVQKNLILDKRIESVLSHINRNIESAFNIDELSLIAGLSKDHFIRLFDKETGSTPLQYINRKKIEEAQLRIVLNEDKSIKDIGFELGFDSPQYFNRVFKKICGESPRKYREINKSLSQQTK